MPRRLACAQNVQIWTTSVLIGIKRMPAQIDHLFVSLSSGGC